MKSIIETPYGEFVSGIKTSADGSPEVQTTTDRENAITYTAEELPEVLAWLGEGYSVVSRNN